MKLKHLQLPFLEADAVVAQLITRFLLEVEVVAEGERGIVLGIAQVNRGCLHLLLIRVVDAERERARERHLVRGPARVVDVQLRERHRPVDPLAVAPLVLVVGERHGTDLPVAAFIDRPGVAHRALEREIRVERLLAEIDVAIETGRDLPVHLFGFADRVELAVAVQRLEDPCRTQIALEVVDRGRDVRGQRTRSVVRTPLVVAAAGVAEPVVVAVGVVSGPDLEIEHQPVGDAERADVDTPTAEGRGLVGRIALLNGQ